MLPVAVTMSHLNLAVVQEMHEWHNLLYESHLTRVELGNSWPLGNTLYLRMFTCLLLNRCTFVYVAAGQHIYLAHLPHCF